jgi:quinol monooxygenase YgiN
MAFIQIIEMKTSKIDELTALEEEWKKATEGKRTLRRSIVTRDRNNPSRHLILAFFDSYESAMENSNLPETSAFGEKQAALLDAPPAFFDLDVVSDDAS